MSAPDPQWANAWSSTVSRTEPRLTHTHATVVSRNVRVSKLDAELLDGELTQMLREPVSNALSLVRPGLAETYRLEIDTVIRAVLFWLSVGSHRRATYAQGLQNLQYARTSGFARRVHLFGILSIGGPYAWARMVGSMSLAGWADAPHTSIRALVWRLVQRIERITKVAALLNFAAFLALGQYPSIVERILGLRLVHARPQILHSVSFEFLNRQLVWHAFTEFVMFAMPLVNPMKARAWIVRNVRSVLRLPISVDQSVKELPEDVCAVCFVEARKDDTHVVNPYVTGCGHIYCYVCISMRMMAEADECSCLRCGAKVDKIRQHLQL
ncbi:peroxisome assembly protein (Peroxin-2) [Coemansia sp. RSA 2523]|nr:peroxisome assembly protein (Peroxin-2) [Coemansia sp. RSA 1824]KAJ1805546.1 peroxisome assembly protein (Peroxin-2) [Coemansia sp. RSA 2523]KAJ2536445.1 peroxisome assembly protein (Peroxin-2) [Coemansia sp. RSA 1935]KAJ2576998.1 peroxisome assembly protein (Peroxin-2) [Coemansia sp. RSA 1807]